MRSPLSRLCDELARCDSDVLSVLPLRSILNDTGLSHLFCVDTEAAFDSDVAPAQTNNSITTITDLNIIFVFPEFDL